ncbi:uncharacterized protein B0I36DRAFT_389357 [Microdochium trichocladiopsis]|uniref:Uncharacterized protein n=1 Tax=Microdochium trichocladiopsis TaxID=1682393 RepID=A0A9P8XVC3_9PEZI|nr:uncharacterized protein B0I36DRAFT_389357 [Microdochium trichocladiopsis]KAH7014472.1 hypothetical protein B0I36DRAFT_389357 [Microdochium trichocladiopsis]
MMLDAIDAQTPGFPQFEPSTSRIEIDPNGDVDFILKTTNRQQYVWPAEAGTGTLARRRPDPVNDRKEAKDEYQFRVSSRCLSAASPLWSRTFNGPRRQLPRNQGARLEIEQHKWDATAVFILLSILHGRSDNIPQQVTLDTLTQIAVLVHHYKCHEATNSVVSAWINALEKDPATQPPAHHGRESVMWLFVAWVFARAETFTSLAALAMYMSEGPMERMSLPFPGAFVYAIDNARHKAIEDFLDNTLLLRDSLVDPAWQCPAQPHLSAQCSSILLGQLVRFLVNQLGMDVFSSNGQPNRPFYGISARKLDAAVTEGLPHLSWRGPREITTVGEVADEHCLLHACSLGDMMRPFVERMKKEIPALSLGDFPRHQLAS